MHDDTTPDREHLLAQALGDLITALGRPLRSATGPELLLVAEELTSDIRAGRFERDAQQQRVGACQALETTANALQAWNERYGHEAPTNRDDMVAAIVRWMREDAAAARGGA